MNQVYVALDMPDLTRAEAIAAAVRPHVGGLKLGLEFFCAQGQAGVARLTASGLPVFLDLKLHDIPHTVGRAVAALAPLRPALLTVHAAGGGAMLAAARAAAPAGTRLIAVSVLTSFDESDLRATGVAADLRAQVLNLAGLARAAGADGLVCSGAEVAAVRASWPDAVIVVPGIRPADEAPADQKRVVTPARALTDGASVLVVGRPITGAQDPIQAARAISAALRQAA